MNRQQQYEFLGFARGLFAQSTWEATQWAAFVEGLEHQPEEIAKEALKRHWRKHEYPNPSSPDVIAECHYLRYGKYEAEQKAAAPAKVRTPDDAVADLRWAWSAAHRLFGKDAARLFASRDSHRHITELRRLGWSQDQIDVVIQEITGGEVADSFRDHQRRLRDAWSERVRTHVNGAERSRHSIQSYFQVPGGLHQGDVPHGPVVDAGSCGTPWPQDALDRSGNDQALGHQAFAGATAGDQPQASRVDAAAEVEVEDDNDLQPGTYIDTGEDSGSIPF